MYRDTRSCPNCRETVPRLLEHLRFCASGKTAEEHNLANIDETDRGKRIVMQSVDIMSLQATYPDTFWDIAHFLMKHDFPVYQRTDERTTTRSKIRKVRHMTLEDIPPRQFRQVIIGTGIGLHSTSVTSQKELSGREKTMNGRFITSPPGVDVSAERQQKDTTTGEHQVEDNDTGNSPVACEGEAPSPNCSAGQIKDTVERREEQIHTSNSSKRAATPSTKRKRMSNYSDTSCEDVRPSSSRRVRRRILSENESPSPNRQNTKTASTEGPDDGESQSDSGSNVNKINRRRITEAYKSLHMYLTSTEQKHYRATNRYVTETEVKYRLGNLQKDRLKSKHPVDAYMSIILKIMKYLSPQNKLENFRWNCLCTKSNIERMFLELRTTVQLSANTIINYHKGLSFLFHMADGDIDFKLNEPSHHAHLTPLKNDLDDMQKKQSLHVTQGKAQNKAKEAYVDASHYESIYISVFEAFERIQKDIEPIIKSAEAENSKLSSYDLSLVNSFFCLYSMLIGNRPGVIQHMEVEVFDLADGHKKTREDGSSYYVLASANHKTSTNYIAYVYMEEEHWKLLRTYRHHIRPKPKSGHQRYLILNSKGKQLHSPSMSIDRLLKRYDINDLNSNGYRHLIETLAATHMSHGERRTIHSMLTHSEATAQKAYVHGNTALVPHRRGIPLLGRMLNTCALNQNRNVTSFLSRADDLLKDIPEGQNQQFLEEQNQDPQNQNQSRQNETETPKQISSKSHSMTIHGQCADRSASPGQHVSLSAPLSPKDSENWADLERLMDPITAYSSTSNDTYKQIVNDHPELNLGTDKTSVRKYNDWCRHKIQKLRVDETVIFFRRAHNDENLEERVERYLGKKHWKTVKLREICLHKVRESFKRRELSSRHADVPEVSVQRNATLHQIEEQEWPFVKILNAGGKGKGVFATKDLDANTLLCDYHGQLVTEEEGWNRYNELYKGSEDNNYMFNFAWRSNKMWIDAVKGCECHSLKQLKGRLMNHNRKKPNAYPKVHIIDGRPHILLYTKHEVRRGLELTFDYGLHHDKHSDMMPWS